MVKWVETKQNINQLSTSLGKSEPETLDWLNQVLELVNEDETLLAQLNQDKIKILPNQNGLFEVKSKLYIDNGIDENLKSVMVSIGTDWKNYLLNCSIKDLSGIIFNSKDQDSITTEINRILNEGKNPNINKACSQLTSLIPNTENKIRRSIYGFSKFLFSNEINEITPITFDNPTVWEISDKLITKRIVISIANCQNIEVFKTNFGFQNSVEALKWLDDLIT